jgi:hypothetical protein
MRPLSTAALLFTAFVASTPTPAAAQSVQRTIYASALDAGGAPVTNLAPSDFVVREDKVAREILDVRPAADPMELVLLVDNSQAAEQYVRDYREALPAFINAIAADETGARHQISIITLAERPTINTNYTFDVALTLKGAQRIFAMPESGSYLLDALIEVSKAISKRGAVRPVIVAVTTEGPDLSDRSYTTVLEPLKASGAAFHVVIVGPPVNNAQDRAIVLDKGTRDTGGRRDNILTGTALTSRMNQVAAELTHQYRVTYARPRTLIPPDQVTISAARPGLTVRGTPARDVQERR